MYRSLAIHQFPCSDPSASIFVVDHCYGFLEPIFLGSYLPKSHESKMYGFKRFSRCPIVFLQKVFALFLILIQYQRHNRLQKGSNKIFCIRKAFAEPAMIVSCMEKSPDSKTLIILKRVISCRCQKLLGWKGSGV